MIRSRPRTGADGFFPDAALYQPSGPPVPLLWAAHTPEEQQHYLDELQTWVTWLADRYRLDGRYVPECWTKHWELIEELSALHLAWEAAYATTSHADAPLTWHERLGHARVRLAEWVARSGCRAAEHRATA
ncbi:hypothetical protein ICW40_01970 [Actinotalea ferrariae]|uniref:hypothetical protein n=1 Tax=Actinotalea ferrariae TaxID=1386098 RepID=UPI001C8C7738|nr:hypothetical protein [Actinotalea ferrariae]MBX9243571.1 hypothetical protein [Actinotalea ferrariae]